MPSQEEFDELKGRLESLEKQIGGAAPPDFTEEELATFRKVSAAAGYYGEFCGINDCFRPRLCFTTCTVCRTCFVPCIYECTCGPCNQGPIMGGGLQRFGGLGG
ncbi:hypothetical protein [Microbacterium sp. BK668]|uniref:hypothetical protein n=1 Tax=Microbacterium sp. BK668 TaxID=2512118 RepID=UPI0010E202AF|nr:hypothetical protein [Microbacterium sp. BK668]TDN91832.1 hypothetical protein EV279_1337 [Microbacterium sp. BK668]